MTKRPSLASFPPKAVTAAQPDGGTVEAAATPAAAPVQAAAPAAVSHSAKYPKVSVYLTPDEIRTIKLLGVDSGQRVSDICAAAIRDWLETNGHARGKRFKA
jgi:hypothetical protein